MSISVHNTITSERLFISPRIFFLSCNRFSIENRDLFPIITIFRPKHLLELKKTKAASELPSVQVPLINLLSKNSSFRFPSENESLIQA